MHFIGDLSDDDASVVAAKAIDARVGILEFGCGGSTQLLAAHSRPTVPLRSVDTEPGWMAKTSDNMRRLGILRKLPVEFVQWLPILDATARATHEVKLTAGTWDLVFVDGLRALRKHFARMAWRNLVAGGWMLWHDCRRALDFSEMVQFVGENGPEIESFSPSLGESNLAAFRKRNYLQQENWQVGKEAWELGGGKPPDPLPWPLAGSLQAGLLRVSTE